MGHESSESEKIKVIREPFPIEMSPVAERVRRNLLIASFITIFALWNDLKININPNNLGVTIDGLDTSLIYTVLLIILIYELLYFMSYVISHYQYWCIRLTGTDLVHEDLIGFGGSNPKKDLVSDRKQSNFYNWWLERSKYTKKLEPLFQQCEENIKKRQHLLDSDAGLKTQVNEIINTINAINATPEDEIENRLEKFTKTYKTMTRIQCFRWFFLEAGLPIMIGLCAIIWLMVDMFIICKQVAS